MKNNSNNNGLLKKSALGISLILSLSFIIIILLVNSNLSNNNNQLTSSILGKINEANLEILGTMQKNNENISNLLSVADNKTKTILMKLYEEAFNSILQALANQIVPLIQNFNFEDAGKGI